jgi:hypothetical protein
MQNTYIHDLLQDTEFSKQDFLVFPTLFLAFGKNMHTTHEHVQQPYIANHEGWRE